MREIPLYPIQFVLAKLQPPRVQIWPLRFPWSGRSQPIVEPSSFTGKVTLLHFWSYWCPPCVEELPAIIDFVESEKERVHFVPILESRGDNLALAYTKAEKFLEDKPWKSHFVWYIDHDWRLLNAFWGIAIPATVFLNRDGLLALLEENGIMTHIMVGQRNWSDKRYAELVRNIFEDNDARKRGDH
jgi:thiol-disulfide isomerase/thioredoxin